MKLMQKFGFEVNTIEQNARIKLGSPQNTPTYTSPVNNNDINVTASHHPFIMNNCVNTTVSNGSGGRFTYQQPCTAFASGPGPGGQFFYQQPSAPMSTASYHPHFAFGQQNSFRPACVDPQLLSSRGVQSESSEGFGGHGQGQKYAYGDDRMRLPTSYGSNHGSQSTAFATVTQRVEVQPTPEQPDVSENSLVETDEQLIPEDFSSFPFSDQLPNVEWPDNDYWLDPESGEA